MLIYRYVAILLKMETKKLLKDTIRNSKAFLIFLILTGLIFNTTYAKVTHYTYCQNNPNELHLYAPGQSIGIASVPNLRDLGGYQTRDKSIVIKGLVYRSDQLTKISPADMKKFVRLNLKNIYDLRTKEEREIRPDELPPNVKYSWLDVLADSPQAGPAVLEKLIKNPKEANATLGGGKIENLFQNSYRQFITLPSAKLAYHKLFLAFTDRKNLPALFHCTTGKDRTGWAAAALLSLLGVPKDVIMQDYLRSNEYILPAYKKEIDAFVAAGGDKRIPLAIFGVKKEYLNAAFNEMETKYGSIENYFSKALNINAAQQKAIREILLSKK